jgi:DMSO/TMAO reductase YedYZ molybdopterin-dependent catalytic subunit
MKKIQRLASVSLVCCGVLFAQTEAALTIDGDIPQPLTLTKADLAKMPRTTVTLSDQGTDTVYEGVLLYDVLKRAGAPLDKQLMGKALATYVLAEARDGYQVVYALAEIDPAFTDNQILVADTANGKPLFQYQGPFRLVLPHEKKGARSIRMLEKLTVVRLRK